MKGWWLAGYSQFRGDTHLISFRLVLGLMDTGREQTPIPTHFSEFCMCHICHCALGPQMSPGEPGAREERLLHDRKSQVNSLVPFVTLSSLKGTSPVVAATLQMTGVDSRCSFPSQACECASGRASQAWPHRHLCFFLPWRLFSLKSSGVARTQLADKNWSV